MKNFLKEAIITLALVVVIFFGARAAVQTYEVFQNSMLPNFYEGQRVVVNKAAYWFGDPQRGDVVILKAPSGVDENWIKRIIGLPGDKVSVSSGVTYVNGVALEEPYVINPFTYSLPECAVPPDSYFFLGDNRNASNDSSKGWLLPREDVIGKAWLISWPPKDWSVVPEYDLEQQLTAAANQSS